MYIVIFNMIPLWDHKEGFFDEWPFIYWLVNNKWSKIFIIDTDDEIFDNDMVINFLWYKYIKYQFGMLH